MSTNTPPLKWKGWDKSHILSHADLTALDFLSSAMNLREIYKAEDNSDLDKRYTEDFVAVINGLFLDVVNLTNSGIRSAFIGREELSDSTYDMHVIKIKSELHIWRETIRRRSQQLVEYFSNFSYIRGSINSKYLEECTLITPNRLIENITSASINYIINKKNGSSNSNLDLPLDDRINLLYLFASGNPRDVFLDYAKSVLPELAASNIEISQGKIITPPSNMGSDIAPYEENLGQIRTQETSGDRMGKIETSRRRWQDRVERSRGQNPIPFLQEQYAAELETGMTIGELRMHDELLAKAIDRWARKHDLPSDLNLDMRTRQQRNDDALKAVEEAQREGRELTFTEREAKRLRQAEYRRQR